MRQLLAHFRPAALLSTLSIMPFMVLEALNAPPATQVKGVIALFAALWLLGVLFLLVLFSLVRAAPVAAHARKPALVLVAIASLCVLAFVWGNVVMDQVPCFLGVPNCD